MGVAGRALRAIVQGLRSSAKLGERGGTAGGVGAHVEVDERRYERDLARLDRTQLHRARVRALVRLSAGFTKRAKLEVAAKGRVDRGTLRQGIGEVVNPSRYEARVISKARHTRSVLDGRRAGAPMPPAKPLERWVRRKLGVSGAEARGVAFLVRRAIKRRGIKPTDFVTAPFQHMMRRAPAVLAEEMNKARKQQGA